MNEVKLQFTDADGDVAYMRLYRTTIGETDVADLCTALQALSDAKITDVVTTVVDTEVQGTAESANPLGTAEDAIRLYMRGADGSNHHADFPAPIDTIFLDDGETVDLADSDVAALITLLETNCKTRNGLAVTVTRGRRVRRTRKTEAATNEGTV